MHETKWLLAAALFLAPQIAVAQPAAQQVIIYSDELRYLYVKPTFIDNGMKLTGPRDETIYENMHHNGPIDVPPINLVLMPSGTNKLNLTIYNEQTPYPPPAPSIGNPYRVDLSFDIRKPNQPPVNRAAVSFKSPTLWPGHGAWGPNWIEVQIVPASR